MGPDMGIDLDSCAKVCARVARTLRVESKYFPMSRSVGISGKTFAIIGIGLTILSEPNTNASAISDYLAFAVELLNEPALLQLVHEPQIDEILRLGLCGLGIQTGLDLQGVF